MKPFKTYNWLIAVAVIILASSCTRTSDSLKAVPQNAAVLTSIDVLSLASKAEMSSFKETKMGQFMMTEMEKESPEMAAIMNEVLSDPTKTGIDPTMDAHMFVDKGEFKSPFIGFALELLSADKFESYIKEVSTAGGEEIEITDTANMKFIDLGTAVLVFDADKALILGSDSWRNRKNLKGQAVKYMSQTTNITANASYATFKNDSKDISVWLRMDKLMSEDEISELPSMFIGNEASYFVDFQDDAIVMDMKSTLSKELQAIVDSVGLKPNTELSDEMLKNFPAEHLGLMSGNFSPELIAAVIENTKEIQGYIGLLSMQGIDVLNIIRSLDGNIVLNFSDIKTIQVEKMNYWTQETEVRDQEFPMITLGLSINNKSTFDDLLAKVKPFLQDKGSYFSFAFDGITVHFAVNDKELLVSTDETVFNGEFDKTLADSDAKSDLKGNLQYTKIVTNLKKYPSRLMAPLMFMPDAKEAFENHGDQIQSIEIVTKDLKSAKMIMEFKKGDKNVIKDILNVIDENFDKLSSL